MLASFPSPGEAIDLGCGAGIDTAAMLGAGWSVFATDAEPDAIGRVRRRVGDDLRLRIELAPMEEVELPTADLVWASFSLFFCDPARFPDVWRRIGEALGPGGLFVGQLLGDRDTWVTQRDVTWFRRGEAEALFDGWAVERFDEEENEGEAWACSGPKHWHVFHVVARKAAGPPA